MTTPPKSRLLRKVWCPACCKVLRAVKPFKKDRSVEIYPDHKSSNGYRCLNARTTVEKFV